MKKLSGLIIFLFCACFSYGQIPNKATVSNSSTQYHIPNMFADLAAKLPVIDTVNNKATPYAGALTILPSDTLDKAAIPPIYISNGRYWGKLVGGGGGGAGVDSVTFPQSPPQICVWSGGLSNCYYLNRYYDSSALNVDSTYTIHFSNGTFVDSTWNPHTFIYQGQAIYFGDTTHNGVRAKIINGETHYVTADSLYDVTLNGDGTIKDSTQWVGFGAILSGGTTYDSTIIAADAQTDFNFPGVPLLSKDYMVFVNGIRIRYNTDFTVVGDIINIPAVFVGYSVTFHRLK